MTSVVTQVKTDEFHDKVESIEKGLREHVILPLGQCHAPKGGIAVVYPATYVNSNGLAVGNAVLAITLGTTTYYVPARIIT